MSESRATLWERVVLAAAKRVLRGRPAPLPDWDARPRRVLFLRHDKIGDMVMATGVMRAIAESHPSIMLDVLASRGNAAVLTNLPFVHEVLVLDGVVEGGSPRAVLRGVRALRARGYDAVVDGIVLSAGVSPVTAMLLAACGARRRIGMRACMGRPRAGMLGYTHPVDPPADPHANHVEYLERLAGPFGVAPADVPHPTLRLSPAEAGEAERAWQDAVRVQHSAAGAGSGPRLLVNVSAGHPLRRWGDEQFVAGIRYVRALHGGVTLVVVGDPGERAAVEAIAAEAGVAAPPTASVRAAFALVAAADAVLTPDTAIAHVASAFRKPCVTLMLPGAEPFTPYRTPGEVVMSPVMEMTRIPVADVTRALERVLRLTAAQNEHAGVGAGGNSGVDSPPSILGR